MVELKKVQVVEESQKKTGVAIYVFLVVYSFLFFLTTML